MGSFRSSSLICETLFSIRPLYVGLHHSVKSGLPHGRERRRNLRCQPRIRLHERDIRPQAPPPVISTIRDRMYGVTRLPEMRFSSASATAVRMTPPFPPLESRPPRARGSTISAAAQPQPPLHRAETRAISRGDPAGSAPRGRSTGSRTPGIRRSRIRLPARRASPGTPASSADRAAPWLPAQTTATGVRASSSRSAEISKLVSAPRCTPPIPPVANTFIPARCAQIIVAATVVAPCLPGRHSVRQVVAAELQHVLARTPATPVRPR